VRIVVLVEAVPDAAGQGRPGAAGRLHRSAAVPVPGGNDEAALWARPA
jgi:hypothetical protein